MVPCDTVGVVTVDDEQDSMKSAGSGIQLPLLSHVTLRMFLFDSMVFMLDKYPFPQVNIKIKLPSIELYM